MWKFDNDKLVEGNTSSDRGRRPEGDLYHEFSFASPDMDCNVCRARTSPETVNRGLFPTFADSTEPNAVSVMQNLSHSRSRTFKSRIAKHKESAIEHGRCYRCTCSESRGPAAETRRERHPFSFPGRTPPRTWRPSSFTDPPLCRS